jgi:beta-glucosidase
MTIRNIALKPAALVSMLFLGACGGGGNNQASRSMDVVLPPGTTQLTFPKGFLFGTSSAAYQVEGAWNEGGRGTTEWDMLTQQAKLANGETGNVAADFYHRYPQDVAMMAKMGMKSFRFSIAWSRIYPTGFPIEMDSNYQPVLDGEGRPIPIAPNPEGVAYYNDLINLLTQNGIEPIVTLYHWDIPLVPWAMGGFANRDVVNLFAAYAQTVFGLYGDRVKYWLTLNEPYGESIMLEAMIGWAMDQAKAGKSVTLSSMMAALKVMPGEQFLGQQMTYLHNYLYASGLACAMYHQMQASGVCRQDGMIGPVLDVRKNKPASSSNADLAACQLYNDATYGMEVLPLVQGRYPAEVLAKLKAEGYAFTLPQSQIDQDLGLMATAGRPDFLGVNYYSRSAVTSDHTDAMFPIFGGMGSGPMFGQAFIYAYTESPESANGVYDPQGLYDTLAQMDQDSNHLPMLITENGCSYPDEDALEGDGHVHDTMRQRFIAGHLKAVWKAIDDGMDVRGYTCWSLLDDFEWFFGYGRRFGLTYVDFEHGLTRTPKDSFLWYSDVVRNNGLSVQ